MENYNSNNRDSFDTTPQPNEIHLNENHDDAPNLESAANEQPETGPSCITDDSYAYASFPDCTPNEQPETGPSHITDEAYSYASDPVVTPSEQQETGPSHITDEAYSYASRPVVTPNEPPETGPSHISDETYAAASDPVGALEHPETREAYRHQLQEGKAPSFVPPKKKKPEKKKRRVLFAALAAVCALALLIGGGVAGAKIALWSSALQENSAGIIQSGAYSIFDFFDGIGDIVEDSSVAESVTENSESILNPLVSIEPDGDAMTLPELFIGANPAVVAISTETEGQNVFGRPVTLPAAGSGFVISSDGYIVTNNHVIEDATTISVLMHDGTRHQAALVGRDPLSDLAVLKINANDLSFLTWADSDSLLVGEQVAAIGNPLGEFANSMTSGIVSALDREINIDGIPRHMLQTDAAVNSGNSGGPLVDMRGQVIGVVTAKSVGTDVEGLGFAIPSNRAQAVTSELIRKGNSEGYGYVRSRAIMGITVGLREENGQNNVYVESVNSGSAAEKADVREGDVIVSANGQRVSSINSLLLIINTFSPGDALNVIVSRNGREIGLTVILDEYQPPEISEPAPSRGQRPNLPEDDDELPFDPWSLFPGFDSFFP